jgi:hypothetical protein
MPLLLTLLAGLALGAAVLLLQPYTADFPGTAYAAPARRFIRAAVRQDSQDLRRLSASAAPVQWALRIARSRPDSLAAWTGHTQAYITAQHADTADVLVYPDGERCGQAPIVLRFVGAGRQARVLQASSACLDRGS